MPILSLVRSTLPVGVKESLRAVRKFVRYRARYWRMRQAASKCAPLRIIVGAAETWQVGWYSTNEQWLDITRDDHWERLFGGRRIVTHVVAEHVMEHLNPEEAERALRLIAAHLVPGGRIRIAVPDGNHPDPDYIRHVGIAGIGDDAADHKQLLTVETLSRMLRDAGFRPDHVEGYTADGALVDKGWDARDGFIQRSRRNPARGAFNFVDAETSLIIDGVLE